VTRKKFKTRTRSKNETPLQILLIESEKAPPIDIEGLREAMGGIVDRDKIYEPPWAIDANPWTKLVSHRRYSKHTRPTLCWYRLFPKREPDPKHAIEKMEQSDTLAGLLGFIPPGLKFALLASKHSPEYVTTKILKEISDILANTALEAFRRYQAWKRKKKYSLNPD
jgi:hypothetical protein